MLKVCLALPVFYPTFGGGPLRFLRYQAGLRKRNVYCRILAGTARPKDDLHGQGNTLPNARSADHRIGTRLPVEDIDGTPVHRIRLPDDTGFRRTSIFFRALIELCENPKTRPDVIQLHSFERLESLYWRRQLSRLGIPILYTIQIARPAWHPSRIVRTLKKRMLHDFYSGFDGIITSSEKIESGLRALDVATRIVVIPNGVDLERYPPRPIETGVTGRRRLGLAEAGPVLLSVGAVSPRKGADLLVGAWARLLDRHPDTQLVLVGPRHDQNNARLGRFKAQLETSIKDSGCPDRVHLLGVRDDLPEIYAASDLVVLPRAKAEPRMRCSRPWPVNAPFSSHPSRANRRPSADQVSNSSNVAERPPRSPPRYPGCSRTGSAA